MSTILSKTTENGITTCEFLIGRIPENKAYFTLQTMATPPSEHSVKYKGLYYAYEFGKFFDSIDIKVKTDTSLCKGNGATFLYYGSNSVYEEFKDANEFTKLRGDTYTLGVFGEGKLTPANVFDYKCKYTDMPTASIKFSLKPKSNVITIIYPEEYQSFMENWFGLYDCGVLDKKIKK